MNPKIIIIAKQTSYSRYVQDNDVQHLIAQNNPATQRWQSSHEAHCKTLEIVRESALKRAQVFVFDAVSFVADLQDVALVVTVGGDGTLLSASHSLHSQVQILGVNSDPKTSVGFFCAATAETFPEYLNRALDCVCEGITLARMKILKNGRIIDERVLNDVLFCHTSPAITSNYILDHVLTFPNQRIEFSETQKSSGFWIGPAAGSTAARRSAGFKPLDLDSKNLQLCVRELYHRPGSKVGQQEINVEPGSAIRVVSKMDSAAMYIDGDYKVVPVGLGDELVFEMSNDPLLLLGKPHVLRE